MSEIKYLIDIFKDYGVIGVILVAIGLVIVGVIKSSFTKKLYSKLQEFFLFVFLKSKTKEVTSVEISITDSDVSNHDIFNYIDLWTYSKVPTIQFSTEYRTVVFRKYLTTFLKSYKENIKNYISSGDFKNMDNAQLWQSLLKLITDIVYDYEKEMEQAGIPKVVIEKMKVKNNDMINLIIDLIGGICNSTFYNSDNNLLKVYSILNIVLSILENTISGSESTCNSINGQLAGLSFNDGGRIVTEPKSKH
jgi:hypothetical protein